MIAGNGATVFGSTTAPFVCTLYKSENGVPVAIDASGRAIIAATVASSFTLSASASDAAGNVGTDSQILVVRDPHVTNAPTVDLTTPDDNATITAPTPIIGTVQDPNLLSYTLSLAPLGSDAFTNFFTGTSQVINGVLGTFVLDPSLAAAGERQGLIMVGLGTGLLQVLNSAGFVPRAF